MRAKDYQRARHYFNDKSFSIWLRLMALTLISASIAEKNSALVIVTVFICLIVLIKGRWIIDEFMELKYSAPITRKIVKCYFYGMTTLIGLTVSYSQISFQGI